MTKHPHFTIAAATLALLLAAPALAVGTVQNGVWHIPAKEIKSCAAGICILRTGASVIAPSNDVRVVAICTDGFQWRAHVGLKNGHSGACRGHRGVKSWADGSPVRLRMRGLNALQREG